MYINIYIYIIIYVYIYIYEYVCMCLTIAVHYATFQPEDTPSHSVSLGLLASLRPSSYGYLSKS